MIRYDNGKQYSIIFYMTGSVMPSCLPVGICTFAMGLTLAVIREIDEGTHVFLVRDDWIHDPFAVQVIAVVIGYLLVVRTNMALSRWMEGISDIQLMISKWTDAFDALSAFFSGKDATQEQLQEILMFRIRVAHWFSLMSCLCFATLRAGGELGQLDQVPIKELFTDEPQGMKRAKSFAASRFTQSSSHTRRSSERRSWGTSMMGTQGSVPHVQPTGSMVTHRGSFAPASKTEAEDPPAVGKMNSNREQHMGRASSHSKDPASEPQLTEDLDLLVLSMPTAEEVSLLEMARDKPNTICLWIIQAVILMIRKKLLDTPPPIVSRIFQELSNGMLGYNQAHKVAMVPFPFPFAQMVSLLLLILYVFLPIYIDVFTQNPIVTPAISFLLPMVYCALNNIAIELEAPFGTDKNDIDIEIRHQDFLWSLVDVLQSPKMCPMDKDGLLEEEIIRGVLRGASYISPELADFMPDPGPVFAKTQSGGWLLKSQRDPFAGVPRGSTQTEETEASAFTQTQSTGELSQPLEADPAAAPERPGEVRL